MNSSSDAEEVLGVLRQQSAILSNRFSVERIGLFGSRLRGEARPDSDLDILVTLREPTFDNYMGLKFQLEELFGLPVDVVMESALRPRLREHILREVRYAA